MLQGASFASGGGSARGGVPPTPPLPPPHCHSSSSPRAQGIPVHHMPLGNTLRSALAPIELGKSWGTAAVAEVECGAVGQEVAISISLWVASWDRQLWFKDMCLLRFASSWPKICLY